MRLLLAQDLAPVNRAEIEDVIDSGEVEVDVRHHDEEDTISLGLAIFASVVLILLVYNRPFRRVFTWVAGTLTGLAVVGALGWYVYGRYQTYAQAKRRLTLKHFSFKHDRSDLRNKRVRCHLAHVNPLKGAKN